jgi:DNA-binding NarL/FixJ family response regulator
MDEPMSTEETMKVLVFSDDANTREEVRLAIGRRPAPGLPRVEFVEVATEPAVFVHLDKGDVDVVILDGEARPAGGMGICRQAKDEIYHCPPIMVIIARRDDGWLATWSRADAVASQPIDPVALAEGVADLMRRRLEGRVGDSDPRLSIQ